MKVLSSKALIVLTIVIGIAFLAFLIISQNGKLNRNEQAVVDLAVNLGLDREQFLVDLKSDTVKNIVEEQKKDVLQRIGGVPSTPQIFFNSEKLALQSYDQIETTIAQLKEEKPESNVLVEIFSDYNCSACFNLETFLEDLKTRMPDLFVNVDLQQKHLPFLNPNSSQLYAQAAEAAKLQNKFSEYNSALFQLIHNK